MFLHLKTRNMSDDLSITPGLSESTSLRDSSYSTVALELLSRNYLLSQELLAYVKLEDNRIGGEVISNQLNDILKIEDATKMKQCLFSFGFKYGIKLLVKYLYLVELVPYEAKTIEGKGSVICIDGESYIKTEDDKVHSGLTDKSTLKGEVGGRYADKQQNIINFLYEMRGHSKYQRIDNKWQFQFNIKPKGDENIEDTIMKLLNS